MNWWDYIVLGRGMVRSDAEALERSGVSRAYYGAFNLSRRWLETNVTPIDDHRAHEQVWETFRTAEPATLETEKAWRMVGDLGNSLRRLRNQVDYDEAVPGLEGKSGQAVASAERIARLLTELRIAA
jgi:hypothetical protein